MEDAAEFSVPWDDAGADGVPAGETGAVALVDDDVETGFGGEGELGFEEGGLAVVVGGFGPAVGWRVVEVHAGFADADAARVSGEGAELVEPVGVGDFGDVGGVDADGGFDGWVLFGELEAGAAGVEVAADGDDAGDAGGGGAREDGVEVRAEGGGIEVGVGVGEHALIRGHWRRPGLRGVGGLWFPGGSGRR